MITEIAPAPERVASEPARPRGRRRAWDEVPRRQIYVPLTIYLLFTLIPFYWILLFALRPAGSTSLLPWPMTFEHFQKVWTERSFGTYFANSVYVGLATLVLTTVVALAGGYALARRLTHRGRASGPAPSLSHEPHREGALPCPRPNSPHPDGASWPRAPGPPPCSASPPPPRGPPGDRARSAATGHRPAASPHRPCTSTRTAPVTSPPCRPR